MSSYAQNRLLHTVSNRHFWVVVLLFVVCFILHYPQQIGLTDSASLFSHFGLSRHALERILLLIPITYSALFLGLSAGITSLGIALIIMLPRVFLISSYPADALFETVGIIVIGSVLNLWFERQRKDRMRRQEIISQLETAEKGLRTSELKYRNLFENASDAMWFHDLEGNIIDANKACEILTGYSRQELKAINCENLLGSKEYLDLARQVRSSLLNGTQIDQPYEQRLLRKDGTTRIVSMATSLVAVEGEIQGFQHIARDVTEAKMMRDMLAKITDGSPIPAFVIDKQHVVTHWNMAIRSLSGISIMEVVGTDRQWQAFYKEKRPTMADLIIDGASAGEVSAYYQGKYSKSGLIDGAYEAEDFFPDLGEEGKWLHFTASPIKNEDGEVIGAIETLQDITDEKQLQENMQFYTQLITRAQEEERRRIARELHDEASPPLLLLIQRLDAIISTSRPKLSRVLKDSLEDLHSQAVNALDGVRHYAQDLRPRILDDLGLLPALEWMAENMEKEYGIKAEVEVSGNERSLSAETELLLFRIVQEALSNTRRHARASNIAVNVKFSDDKINITVSDNGQGFDLPQRVEDLASTGKLGLIGAQERARLIGGTLKIQSASGKGTIVSVEAPI